MMRGIFTLFLMLMMTQHPVAQNLTGVWEGTMAGGEGIVVNIIKKNNELCGYTSDWEISNRASYCKANFRGWYDDEENVWILVGTSFRENSGEHILMVLRLWHENGDPANTLRGTEEAKYGSNSFFGGSNRGWVRLRKVSSKPPADMPDCFPKVKKPAPSQKPKEAIVKTKPSPPQEKPSTIPSVKAKPVTPPATPAKPKQPTPVKPVETKQDSVKLNKKPTGIASDTAIDVSRINTSPLSKDFAESVKKMNERKKTEFSRIVVHDTKVTLKLYDNGVVDNDTVSVFYNGKLIAGKKRLSEKPIELHLDLDENTSIHEIVMFAENLGSIPPNTALIVVNVDGKRYELHSSASLTENAVLTFEYKKRE
ncbi:MAG: hypothetical protein JST81_01310 [Bacteroidetes bacterium]|nr:hypothetical protein [Bacteroidota bacterium]